MYVRTVKYTNVLGQPDEKKLHFNISKLEMTRLHIKYKDIVEHIKSVIERNNGEELLALIDELIQVSYGEKNEQGYLVKTKEVYERFRWSDMYDEFVLDLLENQQEAETFFTKIIEGIKPQEKKTPKIAKK